MKQERFTAGMKALAAAFGRDLGEDALKVYHGVLGKLSEEQWSRAVSVVLKGERFFPSPAVLLEAAGGGGPNGGMLAEAGRAFDAVVECRSYNPHVGGVWRAREIREKLGDAAADAFVSIGGSDRLNRMAPGDPFVIKEFSAAYSDARKGGRRALPPMPDPPRALPPSREVEPIDGDQAERIVAQIAERASQ